jgi:hypothetical protein
MNWKRSFKKIKIFNNFKLFKNTFVFLEGEHISNSTTSVLKRLNKMGFQIFENEVPENIKELDYFFKSLEMFFEENNEFKNNRENLIFMKVNVN